MELSKIASVSGKGGLFKIISPTRSGLILESLDETPSRIVTSGNQRVSVLDEISIYTTTAEGTIALAQVLISIKEKYGDNLSVDPDGGSSVLAGFMKEILPEYDSVRVYQSDIKKLIKWYHILNRFAPEVLNPSADKKE